MFNGLELTTADTTYSLGGNNRYKGAELVITNFYQCLLKVACKALEAVIFNRSTKSHHLRKYEMGGVLFLPSDKSYGL